MADENMDKRVQRTRELLKNALMQLVEEKGYDAVTIQDITERANLGRSTFYLHYTSKDDLLLDHHIDFASNRLLRQLSYAELMDETPPVDLVRYLQELAAYKAIYFAITRAKDAELIIRGVQQQMVANLIDSLQTAFPEKKSLFALDLLANYIVGAQLALIDWWLANHTPYDANDVATLLHQLQRSAVCDAYGVKP